MSAKEILFGSQEDFPESLPRMSSQESQSSAYDGEMQNFFQDINMK